MQSTINLQGLVATNSTVFIRRGFIVAVLPHPRSVDVEQYRLSLQEPETIEVWGYVDNFSEWWCVRPSDQ